MLRCVKRKSSKSRTPVTGSSNERGCSTLPRMFHRSDSEEDISEKPSSSSSNRLTRWTMEKKSATLTAGSTLSSGNETKSKSKPFTFLRTLSLGSLFSPSRKRRKDDSTTAYSSGLMSPDVELQTLSNESQTNIQQRQNETDVSPSEGSLTPTADETYRPQFCKQELYLEKLTRDAYNYPRDETNKTPTDENPHIVSEGKHLKRYPDDQHDSGRSSTRESADVSVASEGPKKKPAINGLPIELETKAAPPDKHSQVLPNSKQGDINQSFLRAARAGNLEKLRELLNKITDINISNTNGLNALHLACKEGRTDVVKELLSHGASVYMITRKGNSALHIASLAGHLEIVKLLVDHGADINAQSQNGFTPLYMSAQENHVEVVQYLLDKSANQALSTEDGFTPLAVALQQGHDRVISLLLERDSRGKSRLPALHIAAKKDDVHAAKLLLNNSEINVDHTSASGFTPLHIAAHYGNVNIAKLLIEKGANINYQAKNCITPLHVAAKWGKNEVLSELILAGAEVNSRTRDGLTPLHCASRAGQTATVEYLLKNGADHTLKTKNDLTPLHLAAQGANESVVRLLLRNGSNPDDVTIDYLTPLHVAAHCGNVDVARALLNSHCNVNARALNGFTALHIACKKSRVEMASVLLKYGALLEAATETGLTPLHVAAFFGCTDIVSFLLQHGTNVNQTTLRNETALHLAARNKQLETVKTLLGYQANLDCRTRDNQTPLHVAVRTNYLPIVELLLNAGSDPNIMTKDNYTPLHMAIKEDSEDIVRILIEHDANPEVKTKKGFTPLHLAAKYGSCKTAHLLMDRAKSDPNATGPNGFTPVHVATYYNNNKMLDKLTEFGGDVNRPVKNGFTPLHLAAKRNNLDSIHLLASKGAVTDKGSRNGYTPLHLASQDGQIEIVKVLVEKYKAQVNTAAKDGLTPLHLAVQEDKANVAEYLLSSGASIDTKTLKAGFTPLHSSAYRGQLASVRLLLSCVPEHQLQQVINSRTHMGSTPLHLAAQQGHLQVALKLIQMGADPNICNKQGWTAAKLAHKQHYLNLFELLQSVTTNDGDGGLPSSNGIDDNVNLIHGVMPLEKAEYMTDHMISDSEDEADLLSTPAMFRYPEQRKETLDEPDNDITSIPSTPTLDNKLISVRPTTLRIPEYLTALGGETLCSGLHESMTEERVKPMLNGKGETATASQQPVQMTINASSPAALSEWDFDVDNVHSTKNLVKSGFLISFIIDARGGLVEAQRRPGLRFLVPPNAPSGPLRIICRLLRPEAIDNPPIFNDGDCLACRIIEMNPNQMRFSLPILVEVPHIASVKGREREIIIVRSETGNSWKEHTLEANEQAINDSLGDAFDHSDLNTSSLNKRIHRILTYDLPQYFALISRFRQEVAFIGSDGGIISSTVAPQVQAVFPPGSLQKRIKVGLQAQIIPNDVINRLADGRVSVSPVVSIEPRRRKFHKPITLTIPVPRHPAKTIPDTTNSSPKVRLLCSLSGGINPAVWEDITGSTPMTHHKDCVSFTTTVSARLWLMDCPPDIPVTELATRIYDESIEPPILGRFVIYARQSTDLETEVELKTSDKLQRQLPHAQDMKRSISRTKTFSTEFAQIRCICLTDGNNDKTLECLEHYCQVAIGPFVEIQQNKPIWIEMVGNLVPVLRSDEQLNFAIRPFHDNRITFPVRLRDVLDHEPDSSTVTGKIAFVREPRKAQTTLDMTSAQQQRIITLLEFKLPIPDKTIVISTRDNRLADALTKINHFDAIPPVMTDLHPVTMKEERITETDVFEGRPILPLVAKEILPQVTLNEVLTYPRREAINSSLDMKYQKMEEKRKQETDTVFSWSENAFLSSDEGVSTISASGETDDLRKPEAAVLQSVSQADVTDQEKLPVDVHTVPTMFTSVENASDQILVLSHYDDVTEEKPHVHWQEALLAHLESVGVRLDLPTKFSQLADKQIEEPDSQITEVFMKPISQYVEHKSTSTDRKQIKYVVQELLDAIGPQFVDTALVEQLLPTDRGEIMEDIIEPRTFDRKEQTISLLKDSQRVRTISTVTPSQSPPVHSTNKSGISESIDTLSTEFIIPEIFPTEEDMSTEEVIRVSRAQETDEALKKRVSTKQSSIMSSTIAMEEDSYVSPQEVNEEFPVPWLENLQDEESFENAYQRAVLTNNIQQIDRVQTCKITELEVLKMKSDIKIPHTVNEPQIPSPYKSHSDSVSTEVIHSMPKESREIEEVEEVLPDGTVVTKRTESEETTLSVTPDEWKLGVQAAIESGGYLVEKPEEITEVEQVEETLADGTIITRLITTKKVVDRVFERSISEEQSVSSGVNEELFVETDSTIPEVSTTEDQFFYHDQKLQEEQNNDLSKPGTILPNLTDNKRKEQITISETGRKTNDIKDILTENEIQVTQSGHDGKSTHVFKEEYIISAEETEHTETRKNRQLQHATLEQEDYTIGEAKIEENTNETERKLAAIKTNSKDLEEIDGGAIKKSISKEKKYKRNIIDENQIKSEIGVRTKIKERAMKESKIKKLKHIKSPKDEEEQENDIHENQQTKTYQIQKEEEKARKATHIKSEREMEAEYGEVGEGVFEGETEAESAVEVFGERLGQVEADAESEAVEQVESERVSVFAPVELESEALAETAAQPERERLFDHVGELDRDLFNNLHSVDISSSNSPCDSRFRESDSFPVSSFSDTSSSRYPDYTYNLADLHCVPTLSDRQPAIFPSVVSSCSDSLSSSHAITICHDVSSTPVASFVLSNVSNDLSFSSSSSRFVHAGVSDFTRMPLDSVSLFDSDDSAFVAEGLYLGLSQFVSRSSESFTEIPSFVIEDSVISVDAPDVCFTTYSGESLGELSDCRQAGISSVHDISAESVPFFIPEASVLAVSGYEYKSLNELGSSNRLPSIVQDTANVVDSHDIREVSEEGVIGKDSSITNGQIVLQTSGSCHPAFRCDPEYRISDYSNSLITDSFAGLIMKEPNHDTEILYSPKDQDALCYQLQSGVSLVTETPTKSDVLDKSPPSGKSDLTYLAAASGASVAMEFTEEEEEEDEFSMACPGRMKTLEHGDSSQLVHSALDRSAKMLTRLQTYGFRGNLMGTNSLVNLNWHASETKLTTPCIEFLENDENTNSLAHQNIPTSNVHMNKVTELDREEYEDFDGDSLEELNIPFEICNTYNTSREIITDETECGNTSLFPFPETVATNQVFNYDNKLKSDTDCQQDSFIEKEVSRRQHLDSELVISSQSSSTKKISFSPDHELQTSSTADESSLSSHSTIVNVGVMNQSPVVPQLIRGNLIDEKLLSQSLSSQEHDFGVDAPDSIQLLESKTTLASIESDLDILGEEIKLKDDNAILPLGQNSVHLSSVAKRKQSNFISNLLGTEPVVGSTALRTSTDVSNVPVSQPICTTVGHIKTTQRYFHEPIGGHVSFPQISEGSCDKQLKFSNDRAKSSPSSINVEKRIETSDENVTSSSLSEFERLEKELGTSNSTSPSSGHKGSGEDVSSHTSSLSEYLRHEKECESFDEILALPFDSKLKLKFNDLIDINGKPKTVVTDMLTSNNLTPLYGQISTIYEDVAEHHISSLSQSVESPTTSLHSAKDDDQISFTYSSQKDENKSQTGCSDSELLIICSKMLSDPLQAEKSKESLTSSSEIEPLLDRVDDPLTGVEETDSLICSSIYDSLVPSGYENSIYDGTPNMNFGVNDNWRNRISRRIDSLDESEHEQPSKVTDSLCSPSSSDISNRKGENKLSPPEENDQGIIEFNSAHIDILHQQYIGTIVEKQSCTVFPNKSCLNERESSITYGKQPQSTHSDEKQDSSTSVSGVAQYEYLDKPILGNCMTDSLDDSGSVIEQLGTKISSIECSATTEFVTTGIPSCSFSTAPIPPLATESKALKYSKVIKTLKSDVSSTVEKVAVPTTSGAIALPICSSSLQSTYQDGERYDLILKIDLNPQSTVFDTSEDEIFVEEPSNDLQQLNRVTTDDVSAVAVDSKTKETLKMDNVPSGEVSEACKQIKCKEFKESFIVETSSDSDYEMVSITEREKSPIAFMSEKMKKGNEQE